MVRGVDIRGVPKFEFSDDGDCRKIFNQVVEDLDLKFMNYHYNRAHSHLCIDGVDRSGTAFVLIDVDINKENTSSYIASLFHQIMMERT